MITLTIGQLLAIILLAIVLPLGILGMDLERQERKRVKKIKDNYDKQRMERKIHRSV